ncbi:Alpha-L-fucosidase [Klebsormidium nitens]|uniref:alpha-L-fucosidase n=1 Tax=Klebsormidium nitens TaxID=105231 RepID=A0A1Y1HHZ6_KLENI|nr:Alpha-L-fucosidase [Klebsormidium nitens]|eukprot:GAQ78085.1 Alpha-L-fucosidase [Klebsormidium nitens]
MDRRGASLTALALILLVCNNAFLAHAYEAKSRPAVNIRKGLALGRTASYFAAAGGESFPPAPLMPIPNARQLKWERGELSMFLHFGINTFHDVEVGSGMEDPASFNPTELNATQWAEAAKHAGFQFVVIVAKHPDGFCNWPSKYTTHSVAASPFRGGKGDVVREVSDAAREVGIGFGLYLAPWDKHEPTYGNTRLYNEYYMGQLTEIMSEYGPVEYIFYDGAKEGGPEMQYHFDQIFALNHELQPTCSIFSDNGPDVRWVGNEAGWAGTTNWATIDRSKVPIGGGYTMPAYLASGEEGAPDWAPAECETTNRYNQWFWHTDGVVRTVPEMVAIYFATVGRNCHLCMNVPPDRRGLIPDEDLAQLRGFRATLDEIFDTDLSEGANVSASSVRGGGGNPDFAPRNVLDADPETYWATDDEVADGYVELELPEERKFNVIRLQEPIFLGQRIAAHTVDIWNGATESWETVVRETTIGNKRLHLIKPVSTKKVRLVILRSRACPLLSSIGLHYYKAETLPVVHRESMPLLGMRNLVQ